MYLPGVYNLYALITNTPSLHISTPNYTDSFICFPKFSLHLSYFSCLRSWSTVTTTFHRLTMKKTLPPSIETWRDLFEGTDGDSNSDLTSSAISQLKQYPLYKMLNNNSGATAIFGGQQIQFTAQQIQ